MLRAAVLALTCCCVFSMRAAVASEGAAYFTEQQILRISPRSSPAIAAVLVQSQGNLRAAGIIPELRVEHFLTQILTETGGLRRLDEDMNYSAERLQTVFNLPADAVQKLTGHPRETANYVYGDKLGNYGRDTDDGWTYRGSGYIQLTGRYNFRKRGLEIGQPLEQQPELARQAREGLLAAIAYWTAQDINKAADSDKLRNVRALVNPRLEGYEASRLWRRRVQVVLSGSGRLESEGPPGAEQPVAQDDASGILQELGFLQPGATEATSPNEVADALRAFQRSRSLPETGRVDEDTLYALTDPSEWKGRAPPPSNLNNRSPSRRAGIAYDLTTKQAQNLAPGGAAPRRSESHGQPGTGALQSTPALSAAELSELNGSDPFFAPYERRNGVHDAQNNFVPFSVIEPDTRKVVVHTTELPASAIVEITFRESSGPGRYACTGALISRNVVLTAGHCVHDGGPAGRWHQDYIVVPGRNGVLDPFGTCSATKLFSVSGWVEGDPLGDGRLDDIGAIKLDCDVGDKTGWLRFGLLADGPARLAVTTYGYPADKTPTGKQWESDGEAEILTASKLFYRNSTYGGMSGSPVFAGAGADSKIVAVHTNGLHGSSPPWDSYNAGTRLSDELVQGLTAFIEE